MAFACGAAILLADQWSKRAIQSHTSNRTLGWGGVVQFRFAPHRSRSFEQPFSRMTIVISWLLALTSAIVLYRLGTWFQSPLAQAGLGLALGGAASNLVDILERRSIVNVIDLGWWPIFNLADAAILGGLAAAFLS